MTIPTKARVEALIKAEDIGGETEVWSTNPLGDAIIVQYVHTMTSVRASTAGERLTSFRVAVLRQRDGEWHVANSTTATDKIA
jgi:hypothetical protein